jgi:hypothetical protein
VPRMQASLVQFALPTEPVSYPSGHLAHRIEVWLREARVG